MSYTRYITQAFATITLVTATSIPAFADDETCWIENNEQHCKSRLGWYLGAEYNYNKTDISNGDVSRYYDINGFTETTVNFDDDDDGYGAFIGYKFAPAWAVELGYLDLGDREVYFNGIAEDVQQFYDTAQDIYPETGEGVYFALIGSYSLSQRVDLSAKVGVFDWEYDYDKSNLPLPLTRPADADAVSTKSGTDFFAGVELGFDLSKSWQLYFAANYFNLQRDSNEQLAVGLRYYFGKTTSTPIAAAPVVAPMDSDGDGIVDDRDSCPDSDSRYVVDETGCTVMTERMKSTSLVINYANDSAEIDASYYDDIRELAEFIKTYNVQKLTVYGHTSAPGSEAYNQALSERRAESVGQILESQFGIDADVINPVGRGESELLDPSNTAEANAKNRRIELAINERLMLPVEKL